MPLRLNNRILTGWLSIILYGMAQAAPLGLDFVPVFGDAPLRLDSLKYRTAQNETLSVSRLSLLLSGFAFQDETGEWIELPEQQGYLDAASQRLSLKLESLPNRTYRSFRFAIGPDPEANHADPAQYAADHPMNPVLNRLLWDWQSGYIFMALEGRFHTADQSLSGYVFHYANDWNRQWITLPLQLNSSTPAAIEIYFDLEALFNLPTAISLTQDGHITHSREGDPLSAQLKTNLKTAFRINRMAQRVDSNKPEAILAPLYLPDSFEAFPFKTSRSLPQPALPKDNPLTTARVELGEKLFNEKLLSRDASLSCASCHKVEYAFSDPAEISPGVDEARGNRNSMPLFNLAWKSEFFWDGRAPSLREQVLQPITNHLELAFELEPAVNKLKNHADYPALFARAFNPPEPTSEKMALALECYLLTLTSYNSRFDQARHGEEDLTPEEQRGMELFFTEYDPRTRQYGGDCFHCHGGGLFTDHQFHNNGLVPTADQGRAEITGKAADAFRFSTPSLRNVEITAPYMHDGRFKTLEEVIDHYTAPMRSSDTLDPNLAKHPRTGLQLAEEDKAALVAFLKTLTDPAYSK
jgi:cytochrome c peroxidase